MFMKYNFTYALPLSLEYFNNSAPIVLSLHKNKKIAFVVIQYFCNTEKLNRLKTKTHSKLLFISNETNKCN